MLMPGHLLLYHPGVQKLKELVDAGALGDVLCVYGNRQNLGRIRPYENALWSLGVHDLSVILYLLDEDPDRGDRARTRLPAAGCRGRRLLLPALPVGAHRAHAPLVARPAQDAEDDRRRHGEDGRLRRHGARPQGHGLREVAVEARRTRTASGRRARATSTSRRSPPTSRSSSSAASSSVSSRVKATAGRSRRTAPASCVRSTCSRCR